MSYTIFAPRLYDDSCIEAIVTCWNYGDFLAETLPFTLPHVDRLVVVTDHKDAATKALCTKWSVECVVTDVFHEKGDAFNKGAAINIGLQTLRQRGWILQLDADIVLPLQFRNMLAKSALQREILYGAERANIHSYERWAALKKSFTEEPQYSYRYLVSTDADLPVGANLVHKQYGYCPIGFFQLWHSQYMHQHELRYPDTEGTAENMDVQWALRWPRKQRLLLPTFRVFHLDSEKTTMGINWQGRKTKPFTPTGELRTAGYTQPCGYASGT